MGPNATVEKGTRHPLHPHTSQVTTSLLQATMSLLHTILPHPTTQSQPTTLLPLLPTTHQHPHPTAPLPQLTTHQLPTILPPLPLTTRQHPPLTIPQPLNPTKAQHHTPARLHSFTSN